VTDLREYPPDGRFTGHIGRTDAESIPAYPSPPRAPDGAPNVVYVVLDDVGYAQLGCYGSDIETPAFDRLAAGGVRYRNFHTTAMCSPTRASLLTGCNQHTTGMGGIADQGSGYPGYHARITKRTGFLSEILRDEGYASLAVGKWHLAPREEYGLGSTKQRWPLGRGFERFYGFLGAETNQWDPDLIDDNHAIDRPATAEEGYHVTEDLVDQAIGMLNDVRNSEPDRPFFLYFATGACHAPHQAPRDWIDRYAGWFDVGFGRHRPRDLSHVHADGRQLLRRLRRRDAGVGVVCRAVPVHGDAAPRGRRRGGRGHRNRRARLGGLDQVAVAGVARILVS
jgi:arylsulfatase